MFQVWALPGGTMRWSDPLLNVLLYLPLGVLVVFTLQRWTTRALPRLAAGVLFGFALSLSVETAQVYDFARYPSALDVMANTAGALLGACLGLFAPGLLRRRMRPVGLFLQRNPAAAILLTLWLVVRTWPMIPRLSLVQAARKVQAIASMPWSMEAFVSAAVMWNAAGALLEIAGVRRPLNWLALSIVLIPAELFILGRTPEPAEFAGAVAGLLLAFLLRSHPQRLTIAAGLLLFALVVRGLYPFRFSLNRLNFSWIPLQASMGAERVAAWYTLIEKGFWYGSAVWLCYAAAGWRRLPLAALGVAALLAALESAQMWLPGRTPEITDPLLAVAIAGILEWAQRRRLTSGSLARNDAARTL